MLFTDVFSLKWTFCLRPATHDLFEFLLPTKRAHTLNKILYTMFQFHIQLRRYKKYKNLYRVIRFIQYMVHAAVQAHRRRTSETPYSRPYRRVPNYEDVAHISEQPHPWRRTSYWHAVAVTVPRPASNWHCPCSDDDDAATLDASSPAPPVLATAPRKVRRDLIKY